MKIPTPISRSRKCWISSSSQEIAKCSGGHFVLILSLFPRCEIFETVQDCPLWGEVGLTGNVQNLPWLMLSGNPSLLSCLFYWGCLSMPSCWVGFLFFKKGFVQSPKLVARIRVGERGGNVEGKWKGSGFWSNPFPPLTKVGKPPERLDRGRWKRGVLNKTLLTPSSPHPKVTNKKKSLCWLSAVFHPNPHCSHIQPHRVK